MHIEKGHDIPAIYFFFANGSMKVCYSFERQILLSTLMIGNKLEKKTRKILLAKKYVLIDVEPISSSADEGRPKRKSIWIRPNQQLFALLLIDVFFMRLIS